MGSERGKDGGKKGGEEGGNEAPGPREPEADAEEAEHVGLGGEGEAGHDPEVLHEERQEGKERKE
eukprot:evm.model.NODE_1915_length_20035_cov_46.721489.2